MSTHDDDLEPLVAASYLALAELLEGLDPAGWDTPSLCEGWRIREVVAHLTMPVRYSEDAFMTELRDCQFDFTVLSNRIASRDAEIPTRDLVGNMRDEVMRNWTPPGGGYHGALSHVVIHGLDISAALGEPRRSSDSAIRVVLEDLTAGGGHAHFGTDVAGRALQATDIDWSYGSGPATRATAEDLVLHLTARAVPAGRLEVDRS